MGASTKGGVLASYSNTRGTLAAPGGDSENPVVTLSLSSDETEIVAIAIMGTSMAVPMVAGLLAVGYETQGQSYLSVGI